MSKKVLSMLLCLSLLVSVFAGCASGSGGDSKAESTATESTTESTAEEGTPESTEESTAETGGSGEPLTILTTLLPAIQDMNTNEMTKWMEEQTGIKVEFQTIPQSAQGGQEKLSLILAGGEYPDVYMNCPFTSDMIAKFGTGEEILMPLDDYIGKITPNLDAVLKKLEPEGITLDTVRQMDGKIYSLPVFDTCQHCEFASKMWYYLPFLEKLGYSEEKLPTTTDEFYELLKKIKTTDLNGNGENDEIPLMTADGGGWMMFSEQFLMNSFLYYKYDDKGMFIEDGTVKSSITQEAFREGLRYMNKLYAEGLLYDGSLTQDSTTATAITESEEPVVAFAPAGFVGIFANLGGERAMGFRPLAPLKGPEGVQTVAKFPQVPTGGYATAYILSSTCKDPESAIKYADFMYTRDATLSIRGGLGVKGKGYSDPVEGELGFDGKPSTWKIMTPWNDLDPQNVSWLALGVWDYTNLRAEQSITQGLDKWTLEGNEWQLYDTTEKFYAPYESKTCEALPPLNFTVEESTELATITTDLFSKSYFDTSRFDFISGARSLDSDWEDYVKYLDENGNKRMLEIYQTAYDRQYKK